ncbi:MAG: glycosyltransferase family 2 protein [Anaerolineae bacterium]|jgi:GT2 family glycosyltransferase|nr:glycosyltransferase family 2 protein [Anaerolineae bacterium]MDH7474135.1 glycosyltransferase family 2 protein [Anaerolineae bacterium]
MLDLSIVIVNWNVRDLLRQCLNSILADLQTCKLEIIIVDNASTDGSVEMVRQEFPQVKLIASEVNLGYTGGNNLGITTSQGRYILLLNPDTEIVGDAPSQMVAYMDAHPNVGALGPQLLNPDGSVQSSRRRFPTLSTALVESTVIQQWWPDNRILRRYYVQDRPDDAISEVDWVTGACILLRRQAVEQVGLLDDNFFMYSEELDWCRRARDAGWKVVYLPTAQVIHHQGKSSEQVLPFRHIRFQTSKIRYFRKHHGRWAGTLVRAFLLLNYVYLLVIESLKWLVGHKRALRAQRIAAYQQVLRSKLLSEQESLRRKTA